MPDTEPTEVIERLRAFADDLTTDDQWRTLLPRARARRRRRSLTGIAAAAAVVVVAAGGVALARPGVGRNAVPEPAASLRPSGVDPWTDPVPGPKGVPVPQTRGYRGGVRLALLKDAKGTYALTAGTVGSSICGRVGAARPAGTAPILVHAWCADDVNRRLWVSDPLSAAGLRIGFVLVTPRATTLVWRQGRSSTEIELHDLPGSGLKVGLIAGPRLDDSMLFASDGSRPLANVRIGRPAVLPGSETAARPPDAVDLFSYQSGPVHRTLWAQHQSDGQVRFVGTAPGVVADTFQSAPPGPDAPIREASLDRVTVGGRWVCGTARADVASVAYRLADGRSGTAILQEVPKGGRVWCVELPDERLDRPPAKGDLIVATLRDGTRYEVAPKY